MDSKTEKPEIISKIERLETPADYLLQNIQNQELISFLDTQFLIEPVKIEEKTYYTRANRGIFFEANPDKLNLIRKLFNSLLSRFNNDKYTLEIYKNDTNAEVFILDDCVVRFYKCSFINNKRNIFELLNANPYLEKILEAKYCEEFDFGYIVSEKLIPLIISNSNSLILNDVIKTNINVDKLKTNINDALNFLHANGIKHTDSRLDNIGYRKSDDSYVLFDLEGANSILDGNSKFIEEQKKGDKNMFLSSIEFHGL